MTTIGPNTPISSNDQLESLLRQASPRPVPSSADEVAVRDAVQAEWNTVTQRRRLRKSIGGLAIAATVLLTVFVSLNSFRVSGVTDIQVASISNSFGSITLLGEKAELHETNNLLSISAGQTIATGSESGIGLNWINGGSMRLDQKTRVVFVDAGKITLVSGRLYFDSMPFGSVVDNNSSSTADFQIDTKFGVVTHQGTQYMTTVGADSLSVSVREGTVSIAGKHYDETVSNGRRVTFTGSRRPSIVNITGFGDEWSWSEKMAAPVDFNERTVHELLLWASRETGLQLHFENSAAERQAHIYILSGNFTATGPMSALRIWMMGIDLTYRIENGVIYISESGTEKTVLTSH